MMKFCTIFLVLLGLAGFQPCFAKISTKELQALRNATKDLPIDETLMQDFITHFDDIRAWIIKDIVTPESSTKSSEACNLCTTVIGIIIGLVRGGVPPLLIQSIVQTACQILLVPNVISYNVCLGVVEMYYDPLDYILKNSNVRALDICGIYTGTEGGCDPINPELTNWVVNINQTKPQVQEPPPLGDSVEPVRFLHLTDIHPDLHYVPGSVNDCGEPMCCRGSLTSNESLQAGPHGDWKCDIPKSAMLKLFQDAANRHNDYKFVLMTGDLVHHKIWGTTKADNILHFNSVNVPLVETIFNGVPIFPVIGNHEPHPCNMFPPRSMWSNPDYNIAWVYDTIADVYADWLPPAAQDTFRKSGYYTLIIPNTNLRLIAINTNFCYTNNFWLFFDTRDPEGQLQWLADRLNEAERDGENVYIAGHIPPGKSDCWNVWSTRFHDIIIRYEHTIKAQFYGHTHNDETTIFFDKSADPPRPANTLNIGVSVTPYTHLHPGYKVFYADGNGASPTWELMDHSTFIYNLTVANNAGEDAEFQFFELYSMKNAFGLSSLRPAELYDMVLRMLYDDELFQKYHRYFHKGYDVYHETPPCSSRQCKLEFLCDVVKADSSDYSHCVRLYDIIDATTVVTETSEPRSTTEDSSAVAWNNNLFVLIISITLLIIRV